ncbi:starvation sensing protein [Candidatus Rickettsiella viridis]|uniref:Starvation sensing protein n=1 Tax=Candidatus Rickettsiella viridis TaxID=676208 RepID=A0A2Z5UT43_9COXI|nr:D-mannonate dehydratase ManD [Candidatus Rickettsiella viridis]BBB14608.1 starvation sensing protein [Candidatus Rickettsiella viridis]
MKIQEAKVFVSCPDRNFVTLKITTDEGVYGVGDATLNGRELAVKAYLEDLIPCLIGRDPAQIEDIWQYFYRGAYWRRGPVTMAAIAAIDMALWDIKGKVLNTPVYNLLGGKSRKGVMVYGHANGKDINDTVKEVGKYIEKGYLAVRAQTGVPGLKDSYGISAKDKMYYEPATKGLPQESEWSTEKYLNYVPKLFKKLREEYGDEVHFLHDSHHRLTPIEAARLGKELEPYHLFWLEDTVPAELQEGFRIIRQHTTTPLAVGEVFNTIWDTHILFTEQLIDYIRMSVVHGGGLTHMKKIAAMAEVYHVKTGCHGPTDVSPITMAAALHFGISINNFGIQEYMRHTDKTNEVFPHAYTFDKGYLYPGDKPGLGVDFDEKLAEKYPYERAYLPVNRKLDGTLFNW